MSENCNHQCGSCGEDCSQRSLLEKPHPLSHIKKVIGVVSGKGGVGKSLVTSLLAVQAQRHGHTAAILDADVTGPSIPRAFGIHGHVGDAPIGFCPLKSGKGIKVMSLNLLLENETDPVVWRGPVIAGAVKQFWTEVVWGDVDFMFVDMPPGTGDVPLTVFQSLPLDGIVIVTSPQELVGMIVEKAINMAALMNVPVLGIVENMSSFRCPDCGAEHHIFGVSHMQEIAARYGISAVSQLPLDPRLASACDAGLIENFEENLLGDMFEKIEAAPSRPREEGPAASA